jgi:hypothetical protein
MFLIKGNLVATGRVEAKTRAWQGQKIYKNLFSGKCLPAAISGLMD